MMKIITSNLPDLFKTLFELKVSYQYDSDKEEVSVPLAAGTKNQCIELANRLQPDTVLVPHRETDEAKLVAMAEVLLQLAAGMHNNQLSGISEMRADESSVQPKPLSVERNAFFSSQIPNRPNSPVGVSDPMLDSPLIKRSSDSSERSPVKRSRM